MIRITDAPIENWSDALRVPRDEVGELVVWGPNVSREYGIGPRQRGWPKFSLRRVKSGIAPETLGRLMRMGRVWFCGRKSHPGGDPVGNALQRRV